jgi:hypothetical protein
MPRFYQQMLRAATYSLLRNLRRTVFGIPDCVLSVEEGNKSTVQWLTIANRYDITFSPSLFEQPVHLL